MAYKEAFKNVEMAITALSEKRVWLQQINTPLWLEDRSKLMQLEGVCANRYFEAWHDYPLPFPKTERRKIPPYWLHFYERNATSRRDNRYAHDPLNAMLNFAYGVGESLLQACLRGLGVDVACGVYHADKDGRDSLVYDLVEPLRPVLDRCVLTYLHTYGTSYADFLATPDGRVCLSPSYAGLLAASLTQTHEGLETIERTVKSYRCTLLT